MAKYIKSYSDEIREIIENITLTPDENIKLKRSLNVIKPYLKDVFEDMYKFFY